MADSPSVLLYYIGKGIVSFKKAGDANFRDLGNVPELELTPSIDKLEHYSSRLGTKTKDRVVVQTKSATVRIVMEEFTAANLALAVLGSVGPESAGDAVVSILALSEITGQLKFVGTNDVGQQCDMLLNNISMVPEAGINLISDEWGQIEITADVLADNVGDFGTMTVRDANVSA